ncbi:MAG: Gfo/Idh/MocA family oxidoreductase [Gemmatimonadaceae bacterium]
MKRHRILFLGCGAATRTHSRILSGTRNVDLCFASRDGARADAYCREFDGVESFDSYERAVYRDLDLVVVATPPATHLDLALLALRSRKNVVVEKPAFMRAADCMTVAGAAGATSQRVFVAENYAYKPIVGVIRDAVEGGELGDVRFVSINATKRQGVRGWRGERSAGGGDPLFEGGIHWVSFLASLGLDIESVEGLRAGSDASSLVVVRYRNGAVGTLAFSWELAAPFGGLRLSKIQGTKGAITFESNGFAAVQTGRRRSVRLPAFRDPTGTRAMWNDFLGALETGAETLYTLDMAQRDLRHVEAASTSFDALEHDVEDERGMRWDQSLVLRAVPKG